MIVDDDEEMSESLRFALEDEGYSVSHFARAQEALDHLKASPIPDLVLLDLVMPALSGWDFRLLQRRDPQLSSIPVIAMSADHSAQAEAIDADAYLRKPIDPHALFLTIAKLITATRKKSAEANHAELERLTALGILAAGMAHEINNPLAVVVGNLEFALKQVHALEPQLEGIYRTHLGAIAQALGRSDLGAQRIAEIMRGVSSYPRSDTPTVGAVNVVDTLEVSLQLAGNALHHRAKLLTKYGETPLVGGNAAELKQVFLTLLTNAVHAVRADLPTQAVISVTTGTTPDGQAEVMISDNGDGLDPALLARVFDPFFSSKPYGGSIGLGLAVSQRLVTGMGGTFSAESTLGKGTTIRLHLPAYRRQTLSVEPALPARGAARVARVLVIDDEPLVCDLLANILGESYEVSLHMHARDAERALLSGESYDVILCDLMMPELSGVELHARIARARPDQAARMVFMTGGTFTESAQRFVESLPDSHLGKPFRPDEVIALIERRLARLGIYEDARPTSCLSLVRRGH